MRKMFEQGISMSIDRWETCFINQFLQEMRIETCLKQIFLQQKMRKCLNNDILGSMFEFLKKNDNIRKDMFEQKNLLNNKECIQQQVKDMLEQNFHNNR
jgi:hypothetical protein